MEKREKFSKAVLVVFLVFLAWTLLVVFAPLALPENSAENLSGVVAVRDNKNKTENMPMPWGSIYDCGDVLCHQKAERSLFLNGNQMPFCTRCTAIWIGLALGAAFLILVKMEIDEKFILVMFVLIAPMGIDGLGQLFGFWESNNTLRLITGLLTGAVCGMVIALAADELSNAYKNKKKKKEI